MCSLRYLFDVKKDGCVAKVYDIADVRDGRSAYDTSVRIAESGLMDVDLVMVADPATGTVERIENKKSGFSAPVAEELTSPAPLIYSVYGKYDGAVVCLSFRHYPEMERPYVLSILTGKKDRDVIGLVAEEVSHI